MNEWRKEGMKMIKLIIYTRTELHVGSKKVETDMHDLSMTMKQ